MGLRGWLGRRFHRRSGLERMVEQALTSGVGLHRRVWNLTELPVEAVDLATLAEGVAAWVAEEMGRTRRPYGIDQMAVGLACAPAGGSPIASVTLGVFRPVEFHGEGGVGERVEGFVRGLPLVAINSHPPVVRIAVALFSWGDLARATIFKD